MSALDNKLKQKFREEALEEVKSVFPAIELPTSFESALILLEEGKIDQVKAFLLFYTIYSEKCEEAARRIEGIEKDKEFEDSLYDTKRFLQQKLKDWTK